MCIKAVVMQAAADDIPKTAHRAREIRTSRFISITAPAVLMTKMVRSDPTSPSVCNNAVW